MSFARTVRASKRHLAATLLPLTVLLAGCGSEGPVAPDQSSGQPHAASNPTTPVQHVEFTGALTTMSARAPGATLVVAGRTVRTNPATVVRRRGDAVAFDRLEVGQVVEVEGTSQPDGSVLAARITIEEENEADDEVEFTGTITSLSSNAPGATLIVAGRTVRTNASTLVRRRGDPVGFDRLAVGQTVEVEGVSLADASVLAARITIENEPNAPPPAPEAEVRFEGTLTAISGTAAAATLTVAGRVVRTDGATEFRRSGSGSSHVGFDALQIGQRLEVRGRQRADNTVLAQRVTIEN